MKLDRFTSSAGDSFSLSYANNPPQVFDKSDLNAANLLFLNIDFLPGDIFTMQYVSGNGFGLEEINVDMTPVPEPSTYAMISTGVLVVFAIFRRQVNQRKNEALLNH